MPAPVFKRHKQQDMEAEWTGAGGTSRVPVTGQVAGRAALWGSECV